MMFTLVRTSDEPRKQQGISLLLIPLKSRGVTVRPIRTIDGWHHVNEVFLDDVEVPAENLVGEEGMGWQYAKFLLQRERLNAANTAPLIRLLGKTRRLVASQFGADRRRDALELRLLYLEAEITGQRELGLRAIDDEMHQRPLDLTPSVLKIVSSRLSQDLSEILLELQQGGSVDGMPVDMNETDGGTAWQNYFFLRSRTIVGGTDEIQKNILSRALFGD
jgi:alkylation response protein AidB-like acyl-CoA dehydrogenase